MNRNFEFYKRITDDPEFGKALLDLLFEGVLAGAGGRVTHYSVAVRPAQYSGRLRS